jgi:hypothetical protein
MAICCQFRNSVRQHNGNCNHKHESDSRKIQEKIIRAVVKRKAASDITTRTIKLVRWEFVV